MSIRALLRRGTALFFCLLLSLAAAPALSQTAPAAPAASTVSPAELQKLVDSLQDQTARQKLVEQLQALIAAQRAQDAAPAPETPITFIGTLSQQIDAIGGEILKAAEVVIDAPWLLPWLEAQIADPGARGFWIDVARNLAIIFGSAALAEAILWLLLRRPSRRLAERPGGGALAAIFLMVLGIIVEGLPIIVFALTASFVLPLLHARFGTQHVAHVFIIAILSARLALVVMRVVLLSGAAASLLSLGEETRHYLYIWARRFINWAAYGMGVASGTWWLGVPGAIYALLLRGTILVLAVLGIIFVLQNRAAVADWLRGNGDAAKHPYRGWRVIRRHLADTWHVLAIIYVAGTFGVYVLKVQGGFLFLLRATVVSVIVLVAAALIVRFAERLSRRGFAISDELKSRFPTLETRANRYLPVLVVITSAIVYLGAALALLQVWGIAAVSWLNTEEGRKLASSFLTIGIVLVVALFAWELFSTAIERYLTATDGNGRAHRSARIRTLLPLVRTTVFVVIAVMVTLIVLSELGINIAPLLAGAGIVGIAIGFGSQALVKDVITGLFILVEDTLAVGDVVDLGKGSGVVEAISVRTIRLRDMAGTVYNIPFSDVTTVKNMSRDYAYAVCDVGVLFREDPDRVIAILREVGAEMAQDPAWTASLTAPLEVVGLDRFTDSAVVIRVRLKTPPLKQWAVAREFNRRMKKSFDQNGIEMPSANQTRYLEPPEEKVTEPLVQNLPSPLEGKGKGGG